MCFRQSLQSEFIKHKRSLLWLVSLLVPLGLTGALIMDVYLRDIGDFLARAEHNNLSSWEALLLESHFNIGWGRFLPIFVTVIAAIVYSQEYTHNSWTNMFSLPIKKSSIYLHKLLLITLFSVLSIFLSTLGVLVVGMLLGFSDNMDISVFIRHFGYQSLAILGVAALHNWISSYFKNIIIPVFIGIGGMIVSATILRVSVEASVLVPYLYPYLAGGFINGGYQDQNPLLNIYAGVIAGIVISVLGYLEFRQRDIT